MSRQPLKTLRSPRRANRDFSSSEVHNGLLQPTQLKEVGTEARGRLRVILLPQEQATSTAGISVKLYVVTVFGVILLPLLVLDWSHGTAYTSLKKTS